MFINKKNHHRYPLIQMKSLNGNYSQSEYCGKTKPINSNILWLDKTAIETSACWFYATHKNSNILNYQLNRGTGDVRRRNQSNNSIDGDDTSIDQLPWLKSTVKIGQLQWHFTPLGIKSIRHGMMRLDRSVTAKVDWNYTLNFS